MLMIWVGYSPIKKKKRKLRNSYYDWCWSPLESIEKVCSRGRTNEREDKVQPCLMTSFLKILWPRAKMDFRRIENNMMK